MIDPRRAMSLLFLAALEAACGPRAAAPPTPPAPVAPRPAPRLVPVTVVWVDATQTLVIHGPSDHRPTTAALVNSGPTGSTVSPLRWLGGEAAPTPLAAPITLVGVDGSTVLAEATEVLVSDVVMVSHGTRPPPVEQALAEGTWFAAYRVRGAPRYVLEGSHPGARLILREAFPPWVAARLPSADAIVAIGEAYYTEARDADGEVRLVRVE